MNKQYFIIKFDPVIFYRLSFNNQINFIRKDIGLFYQENIDFDNKELKNITDKLKGVNGIIAVDRENSPIELLSNTRLAYLGDYSFPLYNEQVGLYNDTAIIAFQKALREIIEGQTYPLALDVYEPDELSIRTYDYHKTDESTAKKILESEKEYIKDAKQFFELMQILANQELQTEINGVPNLEAYLAKPLQKNKIRTLKK